MKKSLLSVAFMGALFFAVSCNDNSEDNAGGTSDTAHQNDNAGAPMPAPDTGTGVDTAAGGTAYAATPLNEMDRQFAMEAASSGMMEVQLGNIAQQTAANPRVKEYAAMMVRDHSKSNAELKGMAAAKQLALPDSLMEKHRKHLEMMQGKTGRDFDRLYMQHMVQAHQEDVTKFQQKANNATDTDLKAFASKNLPVLKMHLDSARAINKAKM